MNDAFLQVEWCLEFTLKISSQAELVFAERSLGLFQMWSLIYSGEKVGTAWVHILLHHLPAVKMWASYLFSWVSVNPS